MHYISLTLAAFISHNVMAATALNDAQQQEMISAHNAWRAKVNTPPVIWSSKLADVA